MFRTILSTVILLSLFSFVGCGVGDPPAEASGQPVPATYEQDQMASQQKAMEEALKNQGR